MEDLKEDSEKKDEMSDALFDGSHTTEDAVALIPWDFFRPLWITLISVL